MLFDEPLSNLDARLRDIVRTEIHGLHGKLGFTAVYVTHDQSEALALGDRIAIMRSGALEQLGTPEEVFEQPATEYVADFIGMANRIVLERDGSTWTHDGDAESRADPDALGSIGGPSRRARAPRGRSAWLPVDAPPPPGSLAIQGTVIDTEFGGLHLDVVVDARLDERDEPGAGGGARNAGHGRSPRATPSRRPCAWVTPPASTPTAPSSPRSSVPQAGV